LASSDARSKSDPWTPDIHKKYPKRVWDVIVRTWRRQLHKYDLDCPSTLFREDSPLSSPTSPSLNVSITSDEDLIDSINHAIQQFQSEENQDAESSFSDDLYSTPNDGLNNLIYSFDTTPSRSEHSIQGGEVSSQSNSSSFTPGPGFIGFHLHDDSNSSMDSTPSSSASLYSSDALTADYISDNSNDSWASMPLTPISMLGSPFSQHHHLQQQRTLPPGLSSTPITHQHQRLGIRSASQHSFGSWNSQPHSAKPAGAASASQHSSPYGAIGHVPRFAAPTSMASSSSSSSSSSYLPVSTFSPKILTQDENMENTSRVLWPSTL